MHRRERSRLQRSKEEHRHGWGNPWKLTAIGLALVIVTALVTGLVVANWSRTDTDPKVSSASAPSKPEAARGVSSRPVSAVSSQPAPVPVAPSQPVAPAVTPQPVSTVPPQAVIDACNHYAAAQVGQRDKTAEVVKDAAIGAVLGAAVGAAGGAIADGGKGAGKGAAIGGIVGAGGGSLYGLNESQKHDQQYRDAYANCMRSRGYTG